MVSQNPNSTTSPSPTKPKRVWKPKAAPAEGVPSMFASATLTKPLKINASAVNTIRRKSDTVQASPPPLKKEDPPVTKSKETPPKKVTPTLKPALKSTPPTATATATAPTKAPTTVTKKAPAASAQPKRESKTNNSNHTHILAGKSTQVAGTPQSWPTPHNLPKKTPPTTRFSKSPMAHSKDGQKELHKNIDHLIPAMYQKKSVKQLEHEQQHEIELMRSIMVELHRQEQERKEKELQIKPVDGGIELAMRILQGAKEQNAANRDTDSDATPRRDFGYSKHMKSKLEYFTSNHSVELDSDFGDDSDDSSSVSSWDSDDGLFRG